MLAAAAEAALSRETTFHDALASELAGLRLNAASAADLVAQYIGMRAASSDAMPRFWLEITFNANQWYPWRVWSA